MSTAVPVLDLSNGTQYASIVSAAKRYKVSYSTMRAWLARPDSALVALGLKNVVRPGAMPVKHVPTGRVFPSIKAAARDAQVNFQKMKDMLGRPSWPYVRQKQSKKSKKK